MQSKTRIMATHHLNRLQDSRIDRILLFKDGTIVADGNFEEIARHTDYQQYASQLQAKQETVKTPSVES